MAGRAPKQAAIDWIHKQDCHGPRMRATQVTFALTFADGTPSELGFNVQNPTGWPAFAGHDIEFLFAST